MIGIFVVRRLVIPFTIGVLVWGYVSGDSSAPAFCVAATAAFFAYLIASNGDDQR